LQFVFGDHVLDADRRELRRGAELIALEPQVFDLLVYLLQNRDRVVSKDDLFGTVWGGRIVSESALTTRINAVRKAIGDNGKAQRLITTVPRKGIRFIGTVREEQKLASRPSPAPRLSIVVLPFANFSNDPEQEYLADGITDDLTTDLSRISGSFVIARSTAFTYKGKSVDVKQVGCELGVRYVLEGSVRRAGDQVQVNVQLIDAESGAHVWADRFDTNRANLVETPNEITGRLARTLNLELAEVEGRRIEQEKALDPDALDLVMRGWAWYYRPRSTEGGQEARRAFEQALQIDPRSVDAKIGLAQILVTSLGTGLSSSFQEDGDRAERLLLEALEGDANRSTAHFAMGILRRMQNRLTESLIEFETTVALDRNHARAIFQLGATLLLLGQPELAIPHVEQAIRLNPHDPNMAGLYGQLGMCHLFLGHLDEAIDLFRRARSANPRLSHVYLDLAGALGLRGDVEEARAALADAIKLKPEFNSLARWRTYRPWETNPQHWALREKTLNIGLRRAGFPDE
jgi:adenylate cyclase